jgi:hypothetical protein
MKLQFTELDNLRLKCVQIVRKKQGLNGYLMGMVSVIKRKPLTLQQCEIILDINKKLEEGNNESKT